MKQQLEKIERERNVLLGQYPHLAAEVTASRKQAIEALEDLLKRAEETLTEKGDAVYFAKDAEEARRFISALCADKTKAVRLNNAELQEIQFDAWMANQGNTVALTDLGEIITFALQLTGNLHPLLANLEGVSQKEILQAMQQYTGEAAEDPQQLASLMQRKIRADILSSDYGVTNAGAIIAENGTIVIAENEGNGRMVSNLPYRHIVVAGIDRLYATAEDALRAIQTAYIYGLAQNNATYYSLISGQSRTADIEFQMAYGMHGPLEVHVILLDNGRKKLIQNGCGNLLKCIDCGGCYRSLQVLAEANGWPQTLLTVKHAALMHLRGERNASKGWEQVPDFVCPVGITVDDLKNSCQAGLHQ